MPDHLQDQYTGVFETKSLAEDLASLLGKATGENFSTRPYLNQSEGIFLLLDSQRIYPGNETGIVTINKSIITITAKYTTGLSYAMYSWLEDLGFRFYLPGDNWNIIPKIKLPSNQIEKTYQPHFKLRMFTASGGVFPVKELDESGNFKQDWFLWHRRNRMGADYIRIDGHRGERFNLAHKEEIGKDPSILAPIEGKRKYSVSGKIDPTNENGVRLFVKWAAEEFKKEQKGMPGFLPFKKYQSVDAGDGYNYCHTAACKEAFASVSDQYMFIANRTAREIRAIDSRAGVSTLAYTERADTPSISIEDNVHVMVVPSAFQKVSYPSELMKRWTRKTKNISQYEFLNIGVWAYDQPFYDLDAYTKYLDFLKDLKIEGLSFETSLSKFASGVQQYFILKYLNEPYTNPDSLLTIFCKDLFGNAAAPVKEIFNDWYFSSLRLKTNIDRPSFYPWELNRFIRNIEKAETTTGLTPEIQSRILELKAYIVYLCKYYELFHDKTLKEKFSQKKDFQEKTAIALLEYTWSLYNARILHNTQLNDLIKIHSGEKEKWNYRTTSGLGRFNENFKPLIESEFKIAKKNYQGWHYNIPDVSEDFFASISSNNMDSFRIHTLDEKAFGSFVYPVEFYAPAAGKFKVRYKSGISQIPDEEQNNVSIIGLESRDYKYSENAFIKNESDQGIVNFKVPSRGFYRLYLSQFKATPVEFIIFPSNNIFFVNKMSVLHNAISLQENADSKYQNKRLGILTSGSDTMVFTLPYYSSKNTSSFFDMENNSLLVQTEEAPEKVSVLLPRAPKNRIIFFENTVLRWQPVLINSAPYFFFIKSNK